jgi:hypothetical protein
LILIGAASAIWYVFAGEPDRVVACGCDRVCFSLEKKDLYGASLPQNVNRKENEMSEKGVIVRVENFDETKDELYVNDNKMSGGIFEPQPEDGERPYYMGPHDISEVELNPESLDVANMNEADFKICGGRDFENTPGNIMPTVFVENTFNGKKWGTLKIPMQPTERKMACRVIGSKSVAASARLFVCELDGTIVKQTGYTFGEPYDTKAVNFIRNRPWYFVLSSSDPKLDIQFVDRS